MNPVLSDPEEDPVVRSVQEVVANPALVRSVGRTVKAVKAGKVPISQMDPGEARVMRIIEETKQAVGIECRRTPAYHPSPDKDHSIGICHI